MATKGATQIKSSVIMALEAEKDAIVKLSEDYSKSNDPKLANQINKLNLHMHAKIAVLSQQLPKDDVTVLDKIQDESNKAVEEAASKNKMQVEYVDIRNVDVNIGGKKEKLHLHLHNILLNATDSNHFVSLLHIVKLWIIEHAIHYRSGFIVNINAIINYLAIVCVWSDKVTELN